MCGLVRERGEGNGRLYVWTGEGEGEGNGRLYVWTGEDGRFAVTV